MVRRTLELDFEAADSITVNNLINHYEYLKKEVDDHLNKGAWMHPEDLEEAQDRLLPALKLIIHFFGKEVD